MERLIQGVTQALKNDQDKFAFEDWSLKRIYGGMNGIIYRAESETNPKAPLAVKIRKRDIRGRAKREYSALQTLANLGETVAPKPIGLFTDIADLPGDVVISGWIEGTLLNDLSDAKQELWERILSSLSRCHSLRPTDAPHLPDAVLPVRSIHDVIADTERRYDGLPDGQLGEITKAEIGQLLDEFKHHALKNAQPAERIGLIVCDTNPTNMIDCDGQIVIVDWENCGWADPAFDIADLLVRPNCAGLSKTDHAWVTTRYAELMDDPRLIERIAIYERMMLIFWLVLVSNGFTGNDGQRFPGTRHFSLEETTSKQLSYLQRIEAARIF